MSLRFSGNSVTSSLNRIEGSRFVFNIHLDDHESGGTFIPTRPYRRGGGVKGQAMDSVLSVQEIARRAKSKVRKYCASHCLNRLGKTRLVSTQGEIPESHTDIARGL